MGKDDNDKDVHDLILSELRYLRGKMDTMSETVTSDKQRLDDHIKEHDKSPERVSAWVSVISCCITVIIFIAGITVLNDKDDKKDKDYNHHQFEAVRERE